MIIHDDLICPHCAARGDKLTPSFNQKDVICRKCQARTPVSELRVALEKSHAQTKTDLNSMRGWFFDMTQKEKDILNKHVRDIRNRNYMAVDLCTPGSKLRRFRNYVTSGDAKRVADEMKKMREEFSI